MIPSSGSTTLPPFLIIPVVCTLLALSPARSSTLASTDAGAARARPVNQDAVAKRLAMGVMAAPTDDARSRALIAVMKALHIGVYTPKGKAMVRGYERGPRDFYLYDFELQAMATAIGQKRFWSSADLAAAFAPLFSSGAQAPTAQTIEEALRSTSRAAVNRPKDKRSLFPLLVRELGLRHATPYDLAGAANDHGAARRAGFSRR